MEAHKVHDRIEGLRFDNRRNRAGGKDSQLKQPRPPAWKLIVNIGCR